MYMFITIFFMNVCVSNKSKQNHMDGMSLTRRETKRKQCTFVFYLYFELC